MAIDLSDEIVCDFLVEAGEILEQLGEQLVDLETRPEDPELLNAVFRGFHTIKGGAGFLGVDPMVAVCHCAEDTFNLLRQGERNVDAPLMDVMLQVLDTLNAMFDAMRGGEDPQPASRRLMDSLGRLARNEPVDEASAPEGDGGPAAMMEAAPVDVTAIAPQAAAVGPSNDEITDDEFEALLDALQGERQGAAGESASVAARANTTPPAPATGSDEIGEEEFDALLDELHGAGCAPGNPSVIAVAATPRPVSAEPAPVGKAPATAGAVAVAGTPPAASTVAEKQPAQVAEPTVRVDTGVLDRIMNMVGELVLVRNRISTLDTALADEELAKAVGNLEVVTADLQAAVMRTRMQPIRKVFGRFPRVVRDLARSLGKEVDLVLQGEDTDLDKNLVEALADPMVHLVRNAVDHGMEMPDVREAAGKPRKGKVTLSAAQEGDHILLTVADDGAGMDAEVLRRKAVEKRLMDEDAAARLDKRDCYHLIFAPGFSTKAEISDVSGRGVGMDVVKSRITQLNGTVDIDSDWGKGTRILIKVPLTLAIVPTLMVVLGPQIFALPLVSVREIFDLDMTRTNVVDGQLTTVVRGKPLPLFFLNQWLVRGGESASSRTAGGHVVVVHVGTQIMGFVVDQLLGQEEVVIKPLGAMLHGIDGLAGATVTGDGRIALILDAPGLLNAYARRR